MSELALALERFQQRLSTEAPNPKQRLFFESRARYTGYGGARGGGKAAPLDEPVLTPFGFVPMGSLHVGSQVCNPDGSVARVIQVHPQGVQPVYRITFIDGASTRCTAEHLWLVSTTLTNTRQRVMTTGDLIERLKQKRQGHFLIPLCEPVQFTRARACGLVQPYTLGVLLGDGCLVAKGEVRFSTADSEIVEHVRADGYEVKKGKGIEYLLRGFRAERRELARLGLLVRSESKFIPESYKYAGMDDRLALLQGLMDTDGYVDSRGHCSFTSVSKSLAEDVQWLVRSFGGKATITEKVTHYTKGGVRVEGQTAYTVYINSKHNAEFFRLPRKKERCRKGFNGGVSELQRRIVSIEPCGEEECQCITVDNPNGLYITKDFIVTHNSWAMRRKFVMLCFSYPNLRVLLLRRTIPELRENHIIPLRGELYNICKYNDDEKAFTFPNGSRLKCGYCENEADVYQYVGQEWDVIGLEEATGFTEMQFMMLKTCNRNVRDDFKPRMYLTGNPGGVGHSWFKRLFIDREYREGEDPNDYLFIPAKVYDNDVLMKNDPAYVKSLEALPHGLREAHLDGRWDVFVGQYFDEWNPEIHVIKPFSIPRDWFRYFVMDYGLDMLAGLWIAMSPQGRAFGYKEIYEPNLKVSVAARRIKEVEAGDRIYQRLAPPDLFATNNQTGESTVEMFGKYGLYFGMTKNDRIPGWYAMKEWLAPFEHEHSTPEKPIWTANLVFFDTCKNFIKNIPLIQHDTKGDPNDCAKTPHDVTHACVVGDTLVDTVDGQVPIAELVGKSGLVHCYDTEQKKAAVGEFSNVVLTRQNVQVVEIRMDDGRVMRCTPDHRVLTAEGWKEAESLCEGDEIVEINLNTKGADKIMAKVLSVEPAGFADVYNMEVKDHHNYSVCGGLVIHNCDAVRYFVTGRPVATPVGTVEAPVTWEDDQYEDYEAADDALKAELLKKWGNPFIGGRRHVS